MSASAKRSGRSLFLLGGILAAVGLVAWLMGGPAAIGALFTGEPEPIAEGRATEEIEEELLADLERRAVLHGFPGHHNRTLGTGALRGRVRIHVAGEDSRPASGALVTALAILKDGDEGPTRQVRREVVADEEGAFFFDALPAKAGWALTIEHRPYQLKQFRGIRVEAEKATDLGDLLLGAPTSLAGQVVDHTGRVPAGIVVQVLPEGRETERFDLRGGLEALAAGGQPLAEVEADAEGRFLVKDLPPGRYTLRVRAPGYAAAFRAGVVVSLAELSETPVVTLDPGIAWYGRILDSEGRGIAGAHVLAAAIPSERVRRIDRVDTYSDANGRYRLDTLVPGVRYWLEGYKEGYAPTGGVFGPLSESAERDIVLQVSGRLEGTITDEVTGKPIAEAEVSVIAGSILSASPVVAVTDEEGRYVFEHIVPGPVILIGVSAPGYQGYEKFDLGGVEGVRIVARETTYLDRALEPGGSVYGRVRDTGSRAVGYATVTLVPKRGTIFGDEPSAITDAHGAYEILGVRPGTYEIRVAAPGYAPVMDPALTDIEVGGELDGIQRDLVLERGASVEGVVRTPEGAPQVGAVVTIATSDPKNGAQQSRPELAGRVRDLSAVTDGVGRYRLDGVPPGEILWIAAEHDAYVRALAGPLTLSPGSVKRADITLAAGASLPGLVTDARGGPVEGARVRFGSVSDEDAGKLRNSFRGDEFLGPRVLRTDNRGEFLIDRLPPGLLLVKIEADGYAEWYRKDLRITDEPLQPMLEIELTGALDIRGRVLGDDTGQPIAEAYVYCEERKPGDGAEEDGGRVKALVSVQTDADGYFTLGGLPPGGYRVVVWFAPGYVGALQEWRNEHVRKDDVPAGTAGLTFRLAREVPPEEPDGVR